MRKFHLGSILLGIVLLFFLVWKIGWDALGQNLSLLGLGLVPFVLIEGVAGIFYTLGWRFCLSPTYQSLPFFRLWEINLAGNSINYFTPTASLGGEVTKGALLATYHSGPEAATGVIIGKLSYALAELLSIVLGSILILWKIHLPVAGTIAMLTGSILLGAGIVGFLLVQKYGKLGSVVRWLVAHRMGGEPLQKAAREITRVDEALKLFYRERPGDLTRSMLCHAAGMLCSILKTWYFLFLAQEGSFFAAAGIWFLGAWFDHLTFALPLGIGVQEGGRILAFKALGSTSTWGLTFGIALRLEQLFWAGLGLLLYAFLFARERRMKILSAKGVASDDPSLD